ncbi:hypothetical protein FKM82_002227 [Ascaphus truei]
MQQNMNYDQSHVFWMNQHRTSPPLPAYPNTHPPPPFPDFRRKGRKDGTCTYLLIVFLLVLLALVGVGLGTYKILQLQKELDQVKEFSSDTHVPPAFEKLVGLNKQQPEQKRGRLAAHVTGKSSTKLPLVWEDQYGRTFTSGIQYKNGALVVNETGLHFLYSSIYFRGPACKNIKLSHMVYKKSKAYPGDLKLMETVEYQYCPSNGMWGRHSYLGAVFNLSRSDALYVNVSDVNLVSVEESKTFFGLYKL